METIHMIDVISILGIPDPQYGQSSYYVQCPCCDDSPYKKHLNINLRKEVFRCPKCGVSGGMFDLYSLFAGIPREQAYKAITEKLRPYSPYDRPKVKIKPKPKQETAEEFPITDVETRDATYRAFLSKLTLSSDHRENLLNRGLTVDEIEKLGYKTMPFLGLTTMAKQLRAEGLYLSGVPGFYKSSNDNWTFIHEKRGILIPVKDIQGRIQGLQIRLDDVRNRKFRWISSAEKQDGCRAIGWTHLAGKVTPTVIITEGPMKADIINSLTGLTVLAVPGVNTLTQLKITLEELKELGVTHIQTAFDMDFLTNHNVQNGFENLLSLLDEMDFKFGTYLWDAEYKGLDDYIWAQKNKKTGGV